MGVKVMGYRQSQSVGRGLTDWDWSYSKRLMGLSGALASIGGGRWMVATPLHRSRDRLS